MFKRLAPHFTSPQCSLLLVGLMFSLPFTVSYHHLPIPAFLGEWLAALLGVLAMFVLLTEDFWHQLRIPQIAFIFLGLGAIVCMQWWLSMLHSSQYALLVLSYIAWAFVMAILGSYLRYALGWEKLAITLSWFMVVGGVANVIYVCLQIALNCGVKLSFMPYFPSYGALAQQNNFADFMALATASLMYLYAKTRISLKPFIVVLVLFVAMLAVSGSRSTWLYLFAMTLLSIVLQVKSVQQQNSSTQTRQLLRVSLLLIPIFIVIQLLIYYLFSDGLFNLPNERIFAAVDAKTSSARLQFWYTGWHLFTQSPWLGIGVGQLRWKTFLLLDSPDLNPAKMAFEHTHNLFIHLLTEMGIGGCFIALLGLGTWTRFFSWRQLNLETWWLIVLLGVMAIHSMLEYPLWYTYFLGVFTFLLGAGEEKILQFKVPNLIKAAGLGMTSFIIFAALLNLSTLYIANRKIEALLSKTTQTILNQKDRQEFGQELSWVYQNSLLLPYAEMMLARYIVPTKDEIVDQIWLSEHSMRFMPQKLTAYKHVLLLKIKGDHAGAVKQLNRAMIAFPTKITDVFNYFSPQYRDVYLEVLLDVRPVIKSKSTKINASNTEVVVK